MGRAEVKGALPLAGMISTLVRLATVCAPAAMLLILMGRLLTADKGMAFKPLIWIGIAPWGKVFPAKIIFLDVLFPGKNTVDVGAEKKIQYINVIFELPFQLIANCIVYTVDLSSFIT